MIKIIDVIDIAIDFLISDDVNAAFNDVKTVRSINDVNIITNANNNYFYWVNNIKYVMNVKDINDINGLLVMMSKTTMILIIAAKLGSVNVSCCFSCGEN